MDQSTQCEEILSRINLSNSRRLTKSNSKSLKPTALAKNRRRLLTKRPSSIGNVYRCFVGCFCIKSTNSKREVDMANACQLDENIEDALRMIEKDAGKKKNQ